MGRKSRQKGKCGEREVVNLAKEHGHEAIRMWQTAQSLTPEHRACDVMIGNHPCQVKRLAKLPKLVTEGMAHVRYLFMREDGGEWLVCQRATDFFYHETKSGS